MDEQVIDCKRAAVNKDPHINNQTEQVFRLNCFEQGEERDDQYKVVGKETKQLAKCVMPTWTEKRMEEVEGIAEEDTAKEDG